MTTRTARWGTIMLVVAAIGLAGIGIAAAGIGPLPGATWVRQVLPAIALAFGVLVLFTGHLSYPRVQNLRVYLAGYSVGVQSIVYALVRGLDSYLVDSVPTAPPGFAELVLALGIIGTYAYSMVPAFPTFRTTRLATLILVVLQLVVLLTVRFVPAGFGWLAALVPARLASVPVVVVATLTVAIVVINGLLPAQSFYLRGSFSGLALLAGGAWILPAALGEMGYRVSADLIYITYAGAAPFFLAICILFHMLARMDHRASYDPLLHIYNREFASRVMDERSNVSTRPPFAVMMLDIDHFKHVNDTHGHQAGDRVLQSIAHTVQKTVIPQGIVCRYGGEELIVFFPGLTGRDIVPLAKRLRESVERTETTWKRQRIGVTVSIGLSDRRFARQPLSHVVHAADKALYIAKENGRNQVRFVRLKDPRQSGR